MKSDGDATAAAAGVPLTRRELRDRNAAMHGREAAPSTTPHAEPDSDIAVATAETDATAGSREPRAGSTLGAVMRAVGTGVMTAVLLFVVAIAAAAIVVPAATGSTALTVLTSSMEPSLPPGTLVIIRPTAPEGIEPGMVMTYQLKSGEDVVVTHRVMQQVIDASGERVFTTQGDANPSPDPQPVREVQVRGTLWYAIPYLGWVTQVITGDVRVWLIPLAALSLFGYAVFMAASGIRDRAKKRRSSAAS